MNKKILLFLILAIMMGGNLFTLQVFAQTPSTQSEYTVLAPLPGTGIAEGCIAGNLDCKTTLEKYLPGMFNLAVGLSAAFAVLMIVIGGLQYMSTDALQKKEDGKKRIENSVYGLVLVIGAWLILSTINPDLLKLKLSIDSVNIEVPAGGTPRGTLGGEVSAGTGRILPGYTLTQAQVDTNNAMKKDLLDNYNISTNAGPCTNGEINGCTNLVGMTEITFRGVTDLKGVCGCNIMITGGTEGGHESHGPNLPPIDLAFNGNLESYILGNQVAGVPLRVIPGVGTVYTSKVGNRNATFLKESDHWHVVFE